MIIDKRYMYTGGANVTYQSDGGGNKELVFRMTGPPVRDVLATLQDDMRNAARRWAHA